jgi:hypothetical protein
MRTLEMLGQWKQRGAVVARYLLPFVAVGAALGSQILVSWLLPKGTDFPYVVLYLTALCLTAWFGGYVPGLMACLLTMIGLPFALTPGFRLASVAPGQVTLVVILSLVLSLVAQTQRRKREVLIHADELDRRVRERTAELAQAVEALKSEIAQHKGTSQRLQTQLERLSLNFPFPQRLARGGLRAFVAAPLLFESQVFGILIAARREPDSFSSGECEFLRQLSEHVALASHQSETHSALLQAYDDLRQSQQTVMQQERPQQANARIPGDHPKGDRRRGAHGGAHARVLSPAGG